MSFFDRGSPEPNDDPSSTGKPSVFTHLSKEEWEAHIAISQYGDFHFTDAVRPSYDLQVTPEVGYRHDMYHDEDTNTNIPVIMAAVSREKLFDLFMELIDPLGEEVDVVLETSHAQKVEVKHADLYREHIDTPVLKSTLQDFEDLLLHDGCAGIAVLNPSLPQEVQFDEHKLLIVYGNPLDEFERILQRYGVECREKIRFITEAEHVHSTSNTYESQFHALKMRLGLDATFDYGINAEWTDKDTKKEAEESVWENDEWETEGEEWKGENKDEDDEDDDRGKVSV